MRLIRNIAAFLAVPLVAASAYTLAKAFLAFTSESSAVYIPFWAGVFCYMIFQIVFYKPMRTYVFGHELTHAFAAILSGAKIKKFNIAKESGHVVVTKNNVWITLAPYFFPVYTFILIAVYLFAGWLMDISLLYSYFLFFAGISIAFHIALTVYIIGVGQPDLKVYGVFFSYVLIIAVNTAVFSLLAALVFPGEVGLKELYSAMYGNIRAFYMFIFEGIMRIITAFSET